MFASASQSSVDQMFQGLRDRQKIATGGSIGVTRPQDKRTSIRVGAPFDPFMNGVPMSAIPPGHPAAQIADGGPYIPPGHPVGMLLGGGNDTGGLPTDDPADRPPRQRIDARPKAARMMGGPSLPFGGFRARGGPVRPGQAYVVGEQGPELFVPGASGSIVPNAGMSLADRATMTDGARRTGSLSDRKAVPVGRGMTPERRLQTAARHGDLRAAQTLFNADLYRGAPPMLPGAPPVITGAPPMIAPEAPPRGRWTSGFNGSQVWIPEGPPPEIPPTPGRQGSAWPPPGAQNPPEITGAPPETPPAASAPKLYGQPYAPPGSLPPSAIGSPFPGLSYDPPPQPRVTRMDIPGPDGKPLGWVGYDTQTGKGVGLSGAYPQPPPPIEMMPVPGLNEFVPMQGGERVPGLPTFTKETVPGSYVRRSTQGQPAPTQMRPVEQGAARAPQVRTFKRLAKDGKTVEEFEMQWNGEQRGWEPVRFLDQNRDGIDDRQQKPSTAAPAAALKTQTGNAFKRA